MNCDSARQLIGGDPYGRSPELSEHLRDCHACAQFQLEMLTLEVNIRHALERPPGAARSGERRRGAPLLARSGWALAASLVLAVLASLAVWALRPSRSLAHDIVAHVIAEPQSWASNDVVTPAALNAILRKSGVILDATPYSVVYANRCWFRGHYVPHLVVRTAHSLVTVLILRYEKAATRQRFDDQGLAGIILPAGSGSIAVLGNASTQLDDIAQQIQLTVREGPGAQQG